MGRDSGDNSYIPGIMFGVSAGTITFFGAWIYCSFSYGFLFGFGLGWIPSAIFGAIVGGLTLLLWIFIVLIICAFIVFYLAHNMPEVLGGGIIIIVSGILFYKVRKRVLFWYRNRPKRTLFKRPETQPDVIKCPVYGRLNRIRAYSVSKAPSCVSCQNELPEKRMVPVWRWLRQNETRLGVLVAISFIALGISQMPKSPYPAPNKPLKPPEGFEIVCQAHVEISPGVYRTAGLSSSSLRPARLTVRTAKGADYFIKLEDARYGVPSVSFYIKGGESLDIDVPLGSFVFKYAEGQTWCNEHDLFGEDTAFYKAKDIFDFNREATRDGYSTTHWTVELIPRKDGNLRTETIHRSLF